MKLLLTINPEAVSKSRTKDCRTCGNCGWHGEHGIDQIGGCLANSGYTFTEYMERFGQGFNCSWKPIKPVCETCGGEWKVPERTFPPYDLTYKPCPTCRPAKPEGERELLVPVSNWQKVDDKAVWYLYLNNPTEILNYSIACVYYDRKAGKYQFAATITGIYYGIFDSADQAKAAVEKALGIRER